jgi:hypothetical protein
VCVCLCVCVCVCVCVCMHACGLIILFNWLYLTDIIHAYSLNRASCFFLSFNPSQFPGFLV